MSILKLHSEPLQESWLDVYGHMNEAYYLVAFSNATWPLQAHFGIGADYFEETGCALYTVETHLRYLAEVRCPARLDIESMVLGSDARKLHLAHVMMVDGSQRATAEFVLLHFDTRAGRMVAMPKAVQDRLKMAEISPLPTWSGRRVTLKKN